MAVAATDGTLYTMGGISPTFNPLRITATVDAYSPLGNRWSPKARMNTPQLDAGAGAGEGIIYVVGGITPTPPGNPSQLISTLEAYDPKADNWTNKASMPTPRALHVVAVVNGILYVAGGDTIRNFGSSNVIDEVLSTLEAYDPRSDTWSVRAPMPTARLAMAAGVVDGKLYVVGGFTNKGGERTLSTVEAYDPTTDAWTTKAPMPTPRMSLAVGVVNGILYAVGGNGPSTNLSDTLNTVEGYDPKTDSWTTMPPMPTPRSQLGAVAVDDVLYALGGLSHASEPLNVNEAFSPFLHVAIDIKPGDASNTINLKSLGVVPVAILGSATFDPLSVDPSTVTLAGAPVATRGRGVPMTSQGDFNHDGYLDLLLQFRTQSLQLDSTTTQAVLYGETTTGQRIRGTDSVRVVGIGPKPLYPPASLVRRPARLLP
jgi:N-acetylneuraminic acid mutarotase